MRLRSSCVRSVSDDITVHSATQAAHAQGWVGRVVFTATVYRARAVRRYENNSAGSERLEGGYPLTCAALRPPPCVCMQTTLNPNQLFFRTKSSGIAGDSMTLSSCHGRVRPNRLLAACAMPLRLARGRGAASARRGSRGRGARTSCGSNARKPRMRRVRTRKCLMSAPGPSRSGTTKRTAVRHRGSRRVCMSHCASQA